MPRVGDTVDEVYLLEWRKNIGEVVAAGEIICEVETDKANVEVPSPIAGKITELLFEAGQSIKTGDSIVVLDS